MRDWFNDHFGTGDGSGTSVGWAVSMLSAIGSLCFIGFLLVAIPWLSNHLSTFPWR